MPRWIALLALLCLALLGGTAIAGGGGGGFVPPPVLAKTVDVAPISGKVLVRTRGTKRFRALRSAKSIPVGSSLDTTNGHVQLTSATKGGGTQSTEFFDGRFGVGQKQSGLAIATLQGGNLGSCPRGTSRSVARRAGRRLWGHGTGQARTRGHNGAGTVRGTFWLTEDRCSGTFFKVRQGVVVVRDFTRHRIVTLHAGQSYLAPAR